jgi:hypothetical protein
LLNAVLSMIHPELYQAGLQATRFLKGANALLNRSVAAWPSVFSGITVISNRQTPPHRDRGGWAQSYDLLVSAGTHAHSVLGLSDVDARLVYRPGAVVAVCGKLLRHDVLQWDGGERVCFAHYMKDAVLNRLEIARAAWVDRNYYARFMN